MSTIERSIFRTELITIKWNHHTIHAPAMGRRRGTTLLIRCTNMVLPPPTSYTHNYMTIAAWLGHSIRTLRPFLYPLPCREHQSGKNVGREAPGFINIFLGTKLNPNTVNTVLIAYVTLGSPGNINSNWPLTKRTSLPVNSTACHVLSGVGKL